VSQLRSIQTTLSNYSSRFLTILQSSLHSLLHPVTNLYLLSISELLIQIEEATSPRQLTKTVNIVQKRLWKLSYQKQVLQRKRLLDALTLQVLHSPAPSVQLEAAGWLRMLTQAGMVTEPKDVFVTMVTVITTFVNVDDKEGSEELLAYLKILFDCFWPFRYPYPAYPREAFPRNEVFYPLLPLLSVADSDVQDILISIFAELPRLDDAEIVEYLLPIAIAWTGHSDLERRRRIGEVLARMGNASAYEALRSLESDSDPIVRARARQATELQV
jgi:hypothetical protein